MLDNNNDTRRFSYAEPILYRGNSYPSARTDINDNGITREGRIFADANGDYYTLDASGNALPTMLTDTLPEVEITPTKQEMLSAAFNRYLTMNSDKARVSNTPHRDYNPHLRENALQGAKAHAQWDKEHPNLSAWRDAATMIPFGVAAIPLAGGLATTAGETALGQAAIDKVTTAVANPLVEMANTAVGLGFASNGLQDVAQGKFTPNTALDLLGLSIGAKSEIGIFNGLRRNNLQPGKYISNEVGSIPRNIKKEGVKRYTDFIQSQEYQNRLQNAGLENHWQDMKDLTDRRLNNGINLFPGRVQRVVYDDPYINGLSSSGKNSIADPWYGISLKESLFPYRVMPTLDHEIAHWATKSAGVDNKGFLGDIMTYNEGIAPNIPWGDRLLQEIKSNPKITLDEVTKLEDRYKYLIDPQEKRARAVSIFQQAKDNNMSTDEFIDLWTAPNGEIYKFAPEQLRDMSKILTVDNIKKYLNKFLGISVPVGVSVPLLNNNQNGQQ